MENYILDRDIKVFCLTASSFPEGIQAVHDQLDKLVPFSPGRNYFGLSRSEKGVIVYKSAAEELFPGEFEKLNLEEVIIKKGNYTSTIIPDFKNHLPAIAETFQKLLANPDIDPNGWCVEWMLKDGAMRCMVRLKSGSTL